MPPLRALVLALLLACASDPPAQGTPEAVFLASEEWTGPAKDYPQPSAQPSAEQAPLACAPADPRRCRTDQDCACGRDLASGVCAYGTAACLDPQTPCPDLCAGPDGALAPRCLDGQCAQGAR